MRRGPLLGGALALAVLGLLESGARADAPGASLQLLVATDSSGADVTWLPARRGPYRVPEPMPEVSFVVPGATASAAPVPAVAGKLQPRLGVLAHRAGHSDLDLGGVALSLDAVEVQALDADGQRVDPRRSHAALSRTLPSELGGVPGEDRDALSFLLVAPAGVELDALELVARSATGQPIDVIPKLRPSPHVCPEGTPPELVCRRTAALRALGDALERGHPAARARSIRAELGGSLRLSTAGQPLVELKVGGPRNTRLGPIERLRAQLRVLCCGPERVARRRSVETRPEPGE